MCVSVNVHLNTQYGGRARGAVQRYPGPSKERVKDAKLDICSEDLLLSLQVRTGDHTRHACDPKPHRPPAPWLPMGSCWSPEAETHREQKAKNPKTMCRDGHVYNSLVKRCCYNTVLFSTRFFQGFPGASNIALACGLSRAGPPGPYV